TVIKMNSTYLETVNKYYIWKGGLTFGALMITYLPYILFMLFILYLIIGMLGTEREEHIKMLLLVAVPISSFLPILGTWLVWVECFKWTHYPIRYNRKNQQIYAFRLDGT